jgi:carbon monoxide dehydrogenase subunit G
VARAQHLDIEIDVRLQRIESGTELTTVFQVAGRGPLKPVVDRLFERRATERSAQFAACLAARFGGQAPAAPADAGWWRRLWRRISYSRPSRR